MYVTATSDVWFVLIITIYVYDKLGADYNEETKEYILPFSAN